MKNYNKTKPLLKLSIFAATTMWALTVMSNPVLDNIGAGNVSVTTRPNVTTINQNSGRAILNWKSFNIGSQEATHFIQPPNGVALNRISPLQGASQIYGVLTATGKIILVNPAGIYFGPNSYVNVGGLIATTHGINDSDFLSGNYKFQNNTSYSGSVINQGTIISANHGLVALVGSNVRNDGMIQANLGTVVLGSGEGFTVSSFGGNDLVSFAITKPTRQANVTNNGRVIADGGRVMVSAQNASATLDNVINMNGVVQANSVGVRRGEIIIGGGNFGVVKIQKKILAQASPPKPIYKKIYKPKPQQGGDVVVTGQYIVLDSDALIDVSGDNGGGTVKIGGDAMGQGSLQHATNTFMEPGAVIKSNALVNGNGGNVVLWADNATNARGTIEALGGPEGGNGGLVETSAKYLGIAGLNVSTRAPMGKFGTWLLDPFDVTISTNPSSNLVVSGTNPQTYTGDGNTGANPVNIFNGDLVNSLNNNNVIVTADTFGPSNSGTVTVSAPVVWTGATTLTLESRLSLNINAQISGVNGGLVLSAIDGSGTIPQTINVTAPISVANLTVQNGLWETVGALPALTVTNNFTFNPGHATFVRAAGGDGSIGNPYQIVDLFGLKSMTTDDISNPGEANWIINNNINLGVTNTSNWNNGTGYTIGRDGIFDVRFEGTLNGQNFTVSNLTKTGPSNIHGLFAGFEDGANIQNLNLNNFNIVLASGTLGGLASFTNGSFNVNNVHISNSTLTAPGAVGGLIGAIGNLSGQPTTSAVSNASATNVNISGGQNVGGVIGSNSNSATNAAVLTNLTSSGTLNSSGGNAGGLVGFSAGSISTSSSSMSVTSSGNNVGGLVGVLNNNASDSSSSGAVIANGAVQNVGGLIGVTSSGNLTNVTTTSTITSPLATANVGGLVGSSNSVITNAFYTGTINAPNAQRVGGLLGNSTGATVSNVGFIGSVTGGFSTGGLIGVSTSAIDLAYSKGTVTSAGDQVGGLIGFINGGSVNRSFSTANVIGNNYVGGFAGVSLDNLPIQNSYATGSATGNLGISAFTGNNLSDLINVYATGYISAVGISGGLNGFNGGNGSFTNAYWNTETTGASTSGFGSGTATGLTTAQMFSQANFNGFDFTTTWGIIEGQSYPYLKAFYPSTPRPISGISAGAPGSTVSLAVNGSVFESTTTGANGFYYFLTGINAIPAIHPVNTTIADGAGLVAFLDNNPVKGNSVAVAPAANGAVTNFNVLPNSLTLGSGVAIALNNATIGSIIGALADPDIIFSVSGTTLTLGNATNPNIDFTSQPATTYTLDGPLTSFGSSNINIAGPLVLTASSSINGGTSGSVWIQGTVTGNNNPLNITNNGTNGFISSNLSSISNLNLFGSGTGILKLLGTNTYIGTTNINAGTLQSGINNAIPVISQTTVNGSLDLNGFNQTLGGLNGSGQVTNNAVTQSVLTINNPVVTSTFNGSIVNNVALVKDGAGILNLGGNNTYFGPTNILAGTLGIISNTGLSSNTNVTINPTATLVLNNVAVSPAGITLAGGSIQTVGNNVVNSPIVMTASTNNIIGNAGSTLSIFGDITGPGDLTLNSNSGTINVTGDIGNVGDRVASLIVMGGASEITGDIFATGTIALNNPVGLTQDVTYDSSGGNIIFGSTLDGSHDLLVNAGGFVNLANVGASTALTSLIITAPSGINLLGSVVNADSQTYNSPLIFQTITALTGNFVDIEAAISGAGAGTINSNSTVINGSINVGSLAINGNGADNSLAIDTGSAQTFHITGSDTGNMSSSGSTVPTFTNIQNLVGGMQADNTYIFSNNASLSGLLTAGSLAYINTLDFTAYTSAIRVNLIDTINDGVGLSASVNPIVNFSNVNNLAANFNFINGIGMPNKTSVVTVTGPQTGFISDPTTFSGFSNFFGTSGTDTIAWQAAHTQQGFGSQASQVYLVAGSTMAFFNFIFDGVNPVPPGPIPNPSLGPQADISPIIEQGNRLDLLTLLDSGVLQVDNNIDDILCQIEAKYNVIKSKDAKCDSSKYKSLNLIQNSLTDLQLSYKQ